MKAIAFHLPQFHRTDENDGWWGPGFTDWDNVRAASPVWSDHVIRKPHPDIGYYDLLDPAVRRRQAEMARAFGLYGFCYYHYWFGGGRRVLDKPLELLLRDGEPNLPFCFCWANEQWTRRWKGSRDEILMAQTYGDEAEWKAHFDYLLPFFKHPNYIRVDDKPVFYVYRPHEMVDAAGRFDLWRREALRHGLSGLHLIGKTEDWMRYGFLHLFDAAGEFPPHPPVPSIHPVQYPGALTGWDNTPRYGAAGGRRFVTPDTFENELRAASARAPGGMVFVFAWNEWGEGASLEPDTLWGYEFLKRLQSVATESKSPRAYAISVVTCEGFEHRCFDDNAEGLRAAIAATGRDVTLGESRVSSPDRVTIFFGANLFRHLPGFYREALPPDAIVYNMEQAFPGSEWFDHPSDIDYRSFDVWDYSPANIGHLRARGVTSEHVPMCVAPSPSAPRAAKEYDVGFLAHYAPRRDALVADLERKGISVRWQRSGLWGRDREPFYEKAKITLNASFNGPHGIFEEARVSYLVAKGHFVVSERSSDRALEEPYEGIVAFGSFGELPSLVEHWLRPQHAEERAARVAKGLLMMRARFESVVRRVHAMLTARESAPMKTRPRAPLPPPVSAPASGLESVRHAHSLDLGDYSRAAFLLAARNLSEGASQVVEIGTGYGRVSRAILSGAPSRLTTVDRSPFAQISSTERTAVKQLAADAIHVPLGNADLLVVDIQNLQDLAPVLPRHASVAKRILIAGTHAYRDRGEDPRFGGVWPAVVELVNGSGGALRVESESHEGLGHVVLVRG